MKKYINIFILGLLSGLAFPPLYFIIFLPISFYYLLDKINNSVSYKNAFLNGLIFGFGYFLLQFYWICFSMMVDLKSFFWLIPITISMVPLICATFIGGATLTLYYIIKKFNIKNKILITLIFAILFIFFEYLRSFIFPWDLFAYIVGFSNILMQLVSILNIYIYGIILIFLLSFTYVFFTYQNKKISFNKEYKKYITLHVGILFCIIIFGSIRLYNAKIKTFNINIQLVQANIKQDLKWDKNEKVNNLKKHINMSNSKNADIIIWSESSIPYIIDKNAYIDFLTDKILIGGALRADIKNNQINELWNSIFVFKNGKITDYYDKQVLVPFGEYIPFSKYLPFVKKITNGAIDFSSGNSNKNIIINNIKFNPIICYEIVFPNYVKKKNKDADIILNLTNDGWFGISSGPYQHFVATRFRAVENKTPVIRVSNSGITAYIDEYGRVVEKLDLDIEGEIELKI